MEFQVLSSLDEIWGTLDILNESSFEPSPFLTSGYLRIWDSCFSAAREKLIVAGFSEGQMRGAGVFYLRDMPSTYFLIGGKSLSDRLGFVIERGYERAFVEGFFGYVRDVGRFTGSRFVINNLNGDTPQAEIIADVVSRGAAVRMEAVDSSPFIALPSNFEEYLVSLPGKRRHELRRKMNRARENLGGIDVEVFEGKDSSGLSVAMDEFVRLHMASTTGKLNFWKRNRREFFDAIAREFGASGWLKILFLRNQINDRRVAALVIFDYGEDYLLYNSGFDPSYGKSSPGLVLIAKAIERAIREGKRRFDFLRGSERYKYELGSQDRPVYRVEFAV